MTKITAFYSCILCIGFSVMMTSCKSNLNSPRTDSLPPASNPKLFDLPISVGSTVRYDYNYHAVGYGGYLFTKTSDLVTVGRHTWTLVNVDSSLAKRTLTFSNNRADSVHSRLYHLLNLNDLTPVLYLDTTYLSVNDDTIFAAVTPDSIFFYWGDAGYVENYRSFERIRRVAVDTIVATDDPVYPEYKATYVSGIGLVAFLAGQIGRTASISESLSMTAFLTVREAP